RQRPRAHRGRRDDALPDPRDPRAGRKARAAGSGDARDLRHARPRAPSFPAVRKGRARREAARGGFRGQQYTIPEPPRGVRLVRHLADPQPPRAPEGPAAGVLLADAAAPARDGEPARLRHVAPRDRAESVDRVDAAERPAIRRLAALAPFAIA